MRRIDQCHGSLRLILQRKLAHALTDYQKRFEQSRHKTAIAIAHVAKRHADSAGEIQRTFDRGDFRSVRLLLARLPGTNFSSPLVELTRKSKHNEPQQRNGEGKPDSEFYLLEDRLRMQEEDAVRLCATERASSASVTPGHVSELHAMQFFRETFAKRGAEKRVTQALSTQLENAGPLNSQMLVMRSLSTMRDVSPDYLSRFVSYVDTLLWLEQAGKKNESVAEKAPSPKAKTKTKRRAAVPGSGPTPPNQEP